MVNAWRGKSDQKKPSYGGVQGTVSAGAPGVNMGDKIEITEQHEIKPQDRNIMRARLATSNGGMTDKSIEDKKYLYTIEPLSVLMDQAAMENWQAEV